MTTRKTTVQDDSKALAQARQQATTTATIHRKKSTATVTFQSPDLKTIRKKARYEDSDNFVIDNRTRTPSIPKSRQERDVIIEELLSRW